MGSTTDGIRELECRRQAVQDSARPAAVEAQHRRQKLTARERIARLFDPGTFEEFGLLGRSHEDANKSLADVAGDGVIVGRGLVNGRVVCCVSYDFTVYGGSMGSVNDLKMARMRKFALEYGYPLVFFLEGGGARVQERMGSQAVKGHDRFFDLTLMSGWVPIVAAVVGPSFAGHANLAALADYVPMRRGASLGMAGPRLVEAAVGQSVSAEELGGSSLHALRTGMIDEELSSDEEIVDHVKLFLAYFPTNCRELPPTRPHNESLDIPDEILDVIPASSTSAYDMHRIVDFLVDPGSLFELKPMFARSLITALARVNGYPVGIVASNPAVTAGMLNSPASDKMAHFISLCDAFNLPLIFLVDVPGYLVGVQSELSGIVRHSMKPLYELGQATVPRLTVLIRKAYGLAYHAMGAAEFGPDLIVAWPTAEVSPMGPEGAVNIAYGKSLGHDEEAERKRAELVAAYREAGRPIPAAEEMRLDDVIDPRETRRVLAETLDRVWGRPRYGRAYPPKKHGINPW